MLSQAQQILVDRPAASNIRHDYRCFGLNIQSDLPFPEMSSAPPVPDPDLRIRLRPIARKPEHDHRSTYGYSATEQFLHWPGVGSYLIQGDDTIDVAPAEGASDGLVRLPLLGPVMALLLHQRSRLVLHASAVRISGQLAVFVGDKGAGKSTTTAAAVQRGHGLFTDDLLPVTIEGSGDPLACPGYPSVKLMDDCSGLFSLHGATDLPSPTEDFPKRIRRMRGFDTEAAAPTRIYVLKRSDSARITPLTSADALRAVMRFAYIPLFRTKPWSPEEAHRHFAQCAALCQRTPVAILETPSDLARLPEAIEAVEQDIERGVG